MSKLQDKLKALQEFQDQTSIRIQTLGQFNLWRNDIKISNKDWGRDKTVQLFQYFISHRHRHALHREKIMDHIWEDGDDRDFKVALHGINKILEPERAPRTDPKYLVRQGVSYHLDIETIWIDVDVLEKYVIIGNESFGTNNAIAKEAYKNAIELYKGIYLPNRIYEDWSSEEREKIQVLILGTYIALAEILLKDNPTESIRLAQNALSIDPTWEDAYRLQMQAYIAKGNRPQAIKTYQKCADVLDEEYGIDPLPETRNLLKEIESIQ